VAEKPEAAEVVVLAVDQKAELGRIISIWARCGEIYLEICFLIVPVRSRVFDMGKVVPAIMYPEI
jgi:hypothetical protein